MECKYFVFLTIEESLVVVIFHFRLNNILKSYQKRLRFFLSISSGVFASMTLSQYVFLGMEYQEKSLGFIFLNKPRLGKRLGITELISVKVYTNVQW